MNISDSKRKISNELIIRFLKFKDELPYANIGFHNEYLGWVSNFNLTDSKNRIIHLDLHEENDLFLLFIIAIAWSRTGPWENAAFLVAYLKLFRKDSVDFWKDESNYIPYLTVSGMSLNFSRLSKM